MTDKEQLIPSVGGPFCRPSNHLPPPLPPLHSVIGLRWRNRFSAKVNAVVSFKLYIRQMFAHLRALFWYATRPNLLLQNFGESDCKVFKIKNGEDTRERPQMTCCQKGNTFSFLLKLSQKLILVRFKRWKFCTQFFRVEIGGFQFKYSFYVGSFQGYRSRPGGLDTLYKAD